MLLLMLLSLYQVETPLGSWVNRLVFVLLFSPLGLVAFLKLLTPMGKLVSTPWVGSDPNLVPLPLLTKPPLLIMSCQLAQVLVPVIIIVEVWNKGGMIPIRVFSSFPPGF